MKSPKLLEASPQGERIPVGLVMPHVQDWIDHWYGVGPGETASFSPYITKASIQSDHPEWGAKRVNETLPILVLADASGLRPDTIGRAMRRWKDGGSNGGGTIGYFDADALFTGMDRIDLWARDPELRAVRDELVARMPSDPPCTLPEDNDERTTQ